MRSELKATGVTSTLSVGNLPTHVTQGESYMLHHGAPKCCGKRCTMSMMCITGKHGRAASLDATRRTHSKTYHRASQQRVVISPADAAPDRSIKKRVTESRVLTDRQAPSWQGRLRERERSDEVSR